jgi:hypothetical protein
MILGKAPLWLKDPYFVFVLVNSRNERLEEANKYGWRK